MQASALQSEARDSTIDLAAAKAQAARVAQSVAARPLGGSCSVTLAVDEVLQSVSLHAADDVRRSCCLSNIDASVPTAVM